MFNVMNVAKMVCNTVGGTLIIRGVNTVIKSGNKVDAAFLIAAGSSFMYFAGKDS